VAGQSKAGLALSAVASPAVASLSAYVSGLTLSVPAGVLAPLDYDFTLTLSKAGSDSVTRTVRITVVEEQVPDVGVFLLGQNGRVAPDAPLRIRGSATLPGSGGFDFAWSAAEPLDLTTTGAVLTDPSLDTHNLVISGSILVPGATYTIYLDATARRSGASARASVTVSINRPPFGGTLVVTPEVGTASTTPFEAEALGWDDDPGDTPLSYMFSRGMEEALTFEQASQKASEIYVGEEGTHEIFVEVRDIYGAAAFASQRVTASAVLIDRETEALIRGISRQALYEGKASVVFNVVSNIAQEYARANGRGRGSGANARALSGVLGARSRGRGLQSLIGNSSLTTEVSALSPSRKLAMLQELRQAQLLVPVSATPVAQASQALASVVLVTEDMTAPALGIAIDMFEDLVTVESEISAEASESLVAIADELLQRAQQLLAEDEARAEEYDAARHLNSDRPRALLDRLSRSVYGPLMLALLGPDRLAGEEGASYEAVALSVEARRLVLSALEDEAPQALPGGDGSLVFLPDVSARLGLDDDATVGITFARIRQAIMANLDANHVPVSDVLGVNVLDDDDGALSGVYAALELSGDEAGRYVGAVGSTQNCGQFNKCNDRGTCVRGRCRCDIGWFGDDCNQYATCARFETDAGDWDTSGVRTRSPQPGTVDGAEYPESNVQTRCEVSSSGTYAVVRAEAFYPPPLPPPSPPPLPPGALREILIPRVSSDTYVIVVSVIAGLNALLILGACARELRMPHSTRWESTLARANTRAAAAEKSGPDTPLSLLLRVRFALEDNALLLGMGIGESEPGLRRPELVHTLFAVALAQLCAQSVYFSGAQSETLGDPLDWRLVEVGDAPTVNYLFAHATLSSLMVTPVIYCVKLIFALCFGLPWRASPWGIVRRVMVTLYMCCFDGRSALRERRVLAGQTPAESDEEAPSFAPGTSRVGATVSATRERISMPSEVRGAPMPVFAPGAEAPRSLHTPSPPPSPPPPASTRVHLPARSPPDTERSATTEGMLRGGTAFRYAVHDAGMPLDVKDINAIDRVGMFFGWFVNLCAFACMTAFAIVFGGGLTDLDVSAALVTWVIAIIFSLTWEEPLLIVLLAVLQHMTVRVTGGI